MSRKSPAGKTGPPRFEAGPQGSSAFLFARTMPFFQNAPLRRFRRKKPGNRPCFPTKNRKRLRASTPRRHGAAPKNANSGGMPAPGAKKNAAARVSPKPRHRSPHGTKKFRPARKEVPSAQLRCAEGRSLRPSGGIAGRPAFPVPRRNFRGTLVARRRLSPHRRTASPRFAGFRPAGISSYRPARHSFQGARSAPKLPRTRRALAGPFSGTPFLTRVRRLARLLPPHSREVCAPRASATPPARDSGAGTASDA